MIREAIQEKEREGSRKRKLESAETPSGGMVEAVEEQESDEEIDINQVECLIGEWVAEVELQGFEKDEVVKLEEDDSVGEPFLGDWEAWDDVHCGALPIEEVRRARKEEVTYMQRRDIRELKPTQECYEKTGKAQVSVRWVDTNKRDA